MKYFHERLKIVLKQQKISQAKLAIMLGVSQPTVWGWLNTEYPSLERFYQICCTLKISPNYLLGFDDSIKL